MKRTYAWREGRLVELISEAIRPLPQVMDDVPEFQSPDGRRIRGRAQWREHLKRSETIELGHSDLDYAKQRWTKRRESFQAKVADSGKHSVQEVSVPEGEIRPREKTRLDQDIANRLYNRPSPDRKTLIKLTLESARFLAKQR